MPNSNEKRGEGSYLREQWRKGEKERERERKRRGEGEGEGEEEG